MAIKRHKPEEIVSKLRQVTRAPRHDLGVLLMRRIIDYCRNRGLSEVYGDVLRENKTMIKMCEFLGFETSNVEDDPSIVRVTLKL